jgi:hypothetical protein
MASSASCLSLLTALSTIPRFDGKLSGNIALFKSPHAFVRRDKNR